MMRKKIFYGILLILCTMLMNIVKADNMALADNHVPLGAYLSWEIPEKLGRLSGANRWEYVEKTLKLCSKNSIDTIWVTNMSVEGLPRLLKLCEKSNLLLLVSLSAIEGKIESRHANNMSYYKQIVPKAIKAAGNSKALLGWVLSDEPLTKDLRRIEKLHQMFKKLDPARTCLVVTMAGDTPSIPQLTSFQIACIDPYPFFGPNDPNGPHTAKTSIDYFRSNSEKTVRCMAPKKGQAWVMTQCFVEIWGPRIYENGRYYALKGAYLHWRSPIKAELRWQIWETFRAGAKGTICFQLAPICGADPKDALLPEPEVKWKDVLVKNKTDAGYAGLLDAQFEPTDAFRQLCETYEKIRPFRELIKRWQISDKVLLKAQLPGKSQCFYLENKKQYYAIVVNDDLEKECDVNIAVHNSVKQLMDLLTHKQLTLTSNHDETNMKSSVRLCPGAGTIIQIDAK